MFIRFQWELKSLKEMQEFADNHSNSIESFSGLCAEKFSGNINLDTLYTVFMQQVMEIGDEGFVYILEGDVRGTVCDGVVIYPTSILRCYRVQKVAGNPYNTIKLISRIVSKK